MVKQLLEEVRNTDARRGGREPAPRDLRALASSELRTALSPELGAELERPRRSTSTTRRCPSEAELRMAKAQLVGWLEGLFHGIQATLMAQQMAARQQLEGMRGELPQAGRARTRARARLHLGRFSTGLIFEPRRQRLGVQITSVMLRVASTWLGTRSPRGGPSGGRLVRPPAPAHRVLDARRRGPGRRRGGGGGGRRPAGDRHHRPRQHVRRPRLLQGVSGTRSGIKPIIGTEAYMAHDARTERPPRRGRVDDRGGEAEGGKKLYYHLTLAGREQRRLQEPHPAAQPGLHGGLLLQAPGRLGDARRAQRGRHRHHRLPRRPRAAGAAEPGLRRGAARRPARLQDIFGRDNLFVEIQDHGIPEQHRTNPQLLEIAQQAAGAAARHQRQPLRPPGRRRRPRRPAVRADRVAHERPRPLQVPRRPALPEDRRRDAPPVLARSPSACDNTLWIAERCQRRDRVRQAAAARTSRCPRASPTTPSTSSTSPSRAPASAGATTCPTPWSSGWPTSSRSSATWASARTSSSCGTSSATPATPTSGSGPGRGSAAGCAVAYALRITDLDPIKYDLLFERFLNPSRISMPDIDMDFDSRYRDEMIRYAAERYGRDHVAQIVTFSTIKARAAVRDAARVLGYPYVVGDKVAKAMPPLIMGRDTPLYACLEQHPKYEDGYKMAAELRGHVRHRSRRQGGHRRRQRPRGPAPPGRHPRRGGGDHQGAAHRLPADPAQARVAARTPRTRRSSPSTRCTGSRSSACSRWTSWACATSTSSPTRWQLIKDDRGHRRRHRQRRPRRRAHLRAARPGRHHRRVPARGRRHARAHPLARARLRSRTSPPSWPCTGRARWPRTCTTTTPTARTAASRSSTSTPTPRRSSATPTGLMIYQESVMRVAQQFAGFSLAEADNLRKACLPAGTKVLTKQRGYVADREAHGAVATAACRRSTPTSRHDSLRGRRRRVVGRARSRCTGSTTSTGLRDRGDRQPPVPGRGPVDRARHRSVPATSSASRRRHGTDGGARISDAEIDLAALLISEGYIPDVAGRAPQRALHQHRPGAARHLPRRVRDALRLPAPAGVGRRGGHAAAPQEGTRCWRSTPSSARLGRSADKTIPDRDHQRAAPQGRSGSSACTSAPTAGPIAPGAHFGSKSQGGLPGAQADAAPLRRRRRTSTRARSPATAPTGRCRSPTRAWPSGSRARSNRI